MLAGVALTLAACGGDGDGNGGGKAEDGLTGRGPITFATGKDRSGNLQKMIDAWNAAHPQEKVRIIELPDEPNDQRQQMVQNATTRSDAYTVLNLDVVWTAEFAANRWLVELPKDELDLASLLPATVATGEYRGRLYAMPLNSDAGLLYYRTDLLKKAGVAGPPKTWAEMWAACDKVKALPEGEDVDCFLTEVGKNEGLTVSTAEAVASAGGAILDASGKPAVTSPQAQAGVRFLVDAMKDGRMPRAALTLDGEGGRRHFQAGRLLFHRQWPYQYELANADDGSSKVAGKFAVAPIPGRNGPGTANLGGHNFAISAFATNKATALDFIRYMADAKQQKADALATGKAPTVAALYDDPELVKKYPFLPTLKTAIENAEPRPAAVRYGDVTAAIQGAVYDALSGRTSSDKALADLQSRLTQIASS
ncbi:ABC transporter substrate-binding protein [Actinomadura keratinilytica]|uniref:ABC transporter substrate-binding protein n=2 Tax=Actinomadura keratinilytica TaxID=547461 RepID=A0ABP7YVI0_9ACTN